MSKQAGPPSPVVEAQRVLMRCPPDTIADIHSIVESCDNIAVVRTLEPEAAVVELIATPDTFEEAFGMAQYMERKLACEILHPRPKPGL